EREELSVDQVGEKAEHFGAVAARRQHRAQEVRDAHPRQPQLLRARLQRSEHQRAGETCEQRGGPVHARASGTCRRARSAWWRPRSARSRSESAALIKPTWVKAWGKFPSAAPLSGSISSPKRPTSLARVGSCSKCSSASGS